MRGPFILLLLLWASGTCAEEVPLEQVRAAVREALSVQASLPVEPARLPELSVDEKDSSARPEPAPQAGRPAVEEARSQVLEQARQLAGAARLPSVPGPAASATASGTPDAAAEAQAAASRLSTERVRQPAPPQAPAPGGSPSEPAPPRPLQPGH